MKRMYIKPSIQNQHIMGTELLQVTSIKVEGTEKVENTSDIGFAKKNMFDNYNVWDEDWSK